MDNDREPNMENNNVMEPQEPRIKLNKKLIKEDPLKPYKRISKINYILLILFLLILLAGITIVIYKFIIAK